MRIAANALAKFRVYPSDFLVKNIQVIAGADNCVYDLFAATDEEFELIFLRGENVAFIDEVVARSDAVQLKAAFERIWKRPVRKRDARGIHGTLFYGLAHKMVYYPTRRDEEAINPDGSLLRAPAEWAEQAHDQVSNALQSPAVNPARWPLDPSIIFLNHGSFGSCPLAVLEHQSALRLRLEREPITFLVRELEPLLDDARGALARFVGADTDDLVLIPNATSGVNAVLRSLDFKPGDELLVTDHEYNACRNVANFVAGRTGAKVAAARVPFPLKSADEIIASVLAAVTPRTKLLLIDHVTSQTGMILPVAEIVRRLAERGIDTLIDGAHAPGMIPLDLKAIGAAYYTGNCHKWICAPKGAAFLHVRRDRQADIRPLVISHGANSPRADRSRFQLEFGWMGTSDPSAGLCIPKALEHLATLLPGGWPAIMKRNRELTLAGREVLCRTLGIEKPCPDEMIGTLASIPVPDATSSAPSKSPLYLDPWQDELMARHRIEVPVIPWPAPPKRLLRISAQLYNALPQYELLAKGVTALMAR